jgi:hypothetical protein
MPTETTIPNQDAPARTASRWEDFIDVFFSPSELFRRRANDSWTVPIIVLCVVSIVLYFAFLPVQRVIQEAAMLNNPNMSPQQLEAARNMGPAMQVISGIVIPIFVLVFTLLFGFIAWIAGKITSIDLPFKRALTITAFVSFLTIIQQLVAGVLMSLKLRSGAELDAVKDASFGVLRFMQTSELSAGMVGLLSRIDIFAFWQFAWFAIAFMAAAKASRGNAIIAAAVLWLTGALPFMLQAMSTR